MGTDAMMAEVIRLWTATSHTAEQDANKDAQIALYYQRIREGRWPLRVVAKAFDSLSREKTFWPSWADAETALNLTQHDQAPPQIESAPKSIVRRRLADQAMETETGQLALREGWGRSYHVSIDRDEEDPELSAADIDRFRKGRDEFHELLQSLDPAVPGNDMAIHIGKQMIKGEEQLRERFLQD